jgi:bis(5'-nucleosyl)-tetraphosphatase (symmetrical)
MVLGNHDLHLLAMAYGVARKRPGDTLDAILKATDCMELMDWLRQQPLLHYDRHYAMVHAGLAPTWNMAQAVKLAQEVEKVLQSSMPEHFLAHMYGNQPDYWSEALSGMERLRCITNYLTRMRYCYADGRLDLAHKEIVHAKSSALIPWFAVPKRANAEIKIIFGHWAALNGKADAVNVYALDTGCVWGNCLTAMRLEDEARFSVVCG